MNFIEIKRLVARDDDNARPPSACVRATPWPSARCQHPTQLIICTSQPACNLPGVLVLNCPIWQACWLPCLQAVLHCPAARLAC